MGTRTVAAMMTAVGLSLSMAVELSPVDGALAQSRGDERRDETITQRAGRGGLVTFVPPVQYRDRTTAQEDRDRERARILAQQQRRQERRASDPDQDDDRPGLKRQQRQKQQSAVPRYDAGQAQNLLKKQGYGDIRKLERRGDYYVGSATKAGKRRNVRVHAETGRITEQ